MHCKSKKKSIQLNKFQVFFYFINNGLKKVVGVKIAFDLIVTTKLNQVFIHDETGFLFSKLVLFFSGWLFNFNYLELKYSGEKAKKI